MKKKKTQRADRVQWPSFLQAGMPVSGCHIGHSIASDFRAERAVSRVGGQMEGGCTAQLSSAAFPLLAHTQSLSSHLCLSPCPFIYSFSQSFLFWLSHFPQCCTPSHSQMVFFSMASLYLTVEIKSLNNGGKVNYAQRWFCIRTLNANMYFMHTHTHTLNVSVMEECDVIWSTITLLLYTPINHISPLEQWSPTCLAYDPQSQSMALVWTYYCEFNQRVTW